MSPLMKPSIPTDTIKKEIRSYLKGRRYKTASSTSILAHIQRKYSGKYTTRQAEFDQVVKSMLKAGKLERLITGDLQLK